MGDSTYTLIELAEKAGTSPRVVRFYISKGLLAPPTQRGRNASYGEEHLQRLIWILQQKGEGLTLDQIKAQMFGTASPELTPWLVLQPSPDAVVMTRADVPPWRRHVLKQASDAFAAAVAVADDEEKNR